MSYLIYILCGFLIYQDFKDREVNLYVMLALLATNFYVGYVLLKNEIFLLTGINILLISFLLLSLFAYYSIKNKKRYNIADKELGKGDIIMLMVLTPSFISINLMAFLIGTITFSILIALLFKLKMIPFAGIIAMVFIIVTFLKQLSLIEPYKPLLH